MDKKLLTALMVVLTGLLFLAVGAMASGEESNVKPPKEVLIKDAAFKEYKKGPVKFNHEEHAVKDKIACTECHHVFKDGKNVWKEGDPVKTCGTCHNPEKKEGKMDKLQNAYHKNCKDCHKDLEKEGKPTGPFKKCNDCHQAKS